MLGNGAIGAASVTTLTELFMMVAGLWLLPRGTLGRATSGYAIRTFVAASVMAAVVMLVRDQPIVVPVAAGALVYGLVSLALRTVAIGDINELWRSLATRRAVAVGGER
jgi:pheromone shutdown protein TraB